MKLSKRLGTIWVLNLSLLPTVLTAATCSQLSGSIYTGSNGNAFDIACDTSTVNGNIFAYYSNGDEFQDCVDRCDAISICVVALYLAGSGDCALINSYQGTRSFNGNDIAIKRAVTSTTTTSEESTSSEASSTEVLSIEDSSTATSSMEATTTVASSTEESTTAEASATESSSVDTSSTGVLSTEVKDSSTETSSMEATTTVALSTEPSSVEASSTDVTSTTASTATTSTALSFSASLIETASTSSEASSESSTSQIFTLFPTTTDLPSASTAGVESSTDDCDDETSIIKTSVIETSSIEVTSTATASNMEPITPSTGSPGTSDVVIQTSELNTLASSEASASTSSESTMTTLETQNSISTSLPSSVNTEALSTLSTSSGTTVTKTHTTYTNLASSSWSSYGTTKHGYKTVPVSGIITTEIESASRLATSYPISNCIWTVYLTMVEYVTYSTGVVPQIAITTTYITADGHSGSYRPPVITLPSGCIGGYQVDASGHSYPVAQPKDGSYSNSPGREYSQPSVQPTAGISANSHLGYANGKPHIPAPTVKSQGDSVPEYSNGQPSVCQSTQGSHANSADNIYSQPSVPDHGSPESNRNKPLPTGGEATTTAVSAYGPGAPENPPASYVQAGISTTLAITTIATEERHAPSAISSAPDQAPSTPVIVSGARRHQGMVWTLVAAALFALIV
ncbi:hypothetical protein KAF25_010975 [Fusarium avenaceum]|uniref:Proteoglycan n=1 Tax=Fusarium avenaceum TaxID=40199 RepID=A0A9P7GRS4_9HYPO|nr:hypothetical protein KAF25_010975 [Fusarium avenaceum]